MGISQKVIFRLNSENQEAGSPEKIGSEGNESEKIREWSELRKPCVLESSVWILF